jgi:hypothetical protein
VLRARCLVALDLRLDGTQRGVCLGEVGANDFGLELQHGPADVGQVRFRVDRE